MLSHIKLRVALGVCGIFSLLLLFALSCSSGTSDTNPGKSVSTTYEVSGTVWCDHDDDGYRDPGDEMVLNWPVLYQIEGSSPAAAYTNSRGQYIIYRDEGLYVDVWLMPGVYQPHWLYYYEDSSGTIVWDPESPTIRVDENVTRPLSWVGSDFLH